MEEDLKEIKEKVMAFCKKYNCSLEIDTIVSKMANGDIIPTGIHIDIQN